MSAIKPTERRTFEEKALEMNLTPMMNVITILIPALLVSTVFIEIATVEASIPGQQPAGEAKGEAVDLRITVTEAGYFIAPGSSESREPLSIPLVEKPVPCAHHLGGKPPPAQANRDRSACRAGEGERRFRVFDRQGLRTALLDLKERFPDERGFTLVAEAEIPFEAVIDVMDTSRSYQVAGTKRPLFDQVRFGIDAQ